MDGRREDLAEALTSVFGTLRAEYLDDDLYELFTQPSYWPTLLTTRPCLLQGGRGTGKTTVLRTLSFEGQARLNPTSVKNWPFVGIYWRVNTNVVTAFRGAGLNEEQWTKLFGHYVNLVLTSRVLQFCEWFSSSDSRPTQLPSLSLRRIALSLNLPAPTDSSQLSECIEENMTQFEAFINNAATAPTPTLSMTGRPLEILIEELRRLPELLDVPFCVLVDEFENLLDYQQRVFNSLIKHSSTALTYKIGLKTAGHRERSTLNPTEQLMEPADYDVIDISSKLLGNGFASFAEKICNDRLRRLAKLREIEPPTVRELFPLLGAAAEAELLGIGAAVAKIGADLVAESPPAEALTVYNSLSELERYLISYWADSQGTDLTTQLLDRVEQPDEWANRLNNYQYAMLFTLRRGKRGIRRYYSGWDTYVALSSGNIRFLLFLVTTALQRHFDSGFGLNGTITPKNQTEAAQEVGRRIVYELQGLAVQGAHLTRLVLAFGRIFGVMAAQPHGHTPEVNQFKVNWSSESAINDSATELLTAGVMHLAIERFPGDKAASASGETKDYHYSLHPIFAPFFLFSHRSKRRITVSVEELLGMTTESARSIKSVLDRNSRSEDEPLPDQLQLFDEFYHGAA